MKWEAKIKKAQALRVRGIEVLHERVELLVACYADQGFGAWCTENDRDRIKFLNDEIADTGHEFLTLKAVMDEYPTRSDWTAKGLLVMIAEIKDKQKQTRHREPWKQRALAAEAECERLRDELATEQNVIAELRQIVDELKATSSMEPALA